MSDRTLIMEAVQRYGWEVLVSNTGNLSLRLPVPMIARADVHEVSIRFSALGEVLSAHTGPPYRQREIKGRTRKGVGTAVITHLRTTRYEPK